MILQKQQIFAERYKLLRKLGVGGFSEVWLAEDTKSANMQVALKIFAISTGLDDDGLDTFSKEYSMVFNLNQNNLLRPNYYDTWKDRPFLVMPYMEKGSCTKLCGKMTEKELAKFLVQIGSAIEYLHSRKTPIIHQDIKPDNILIDEQGNYYLTDFGISAKIRNTLTRSIGATKTEISGAMPYMAPEKFSENLEDKKPIKANDIFSLGISAFELLTDELACGDLGGIAINSGAKPSKLPENFSKELQFLISACLTKETWNRPTAEEIVASAKAFLENGIWELPERVAGVEPKQESNLTTVDKLDSKNKINKTKVYSFSAVIACILIAAIYIFVNDFTKEKNTNALYEPRVFNDTIAFEISLQEIAEQGRQENLEIVKKQIEERETSDTVRRGLPKKIDFNNTDLEIF